MKNLKPIIYIILIMILLLLVGTCIYYSPTIIKQGRIQAAKSQIKHFNIAIDNYIIDCETVPPALNALLFNPNIKGWDGPYLMTSGMLPLDPWNVLFRYRVIKGKPVVDSAGPDRIFGSQDDIK